MSSGKYSKLIVESAKKAGVSPEEFYEGIEEAIREGMNSTEPSAKEFWGAYPEGYTPTPEEVVERVAKIVQSEMYGN